MSPLNMSNIQIVSYSSFIIISIFLQVDGRNLLVTDHAFLDVNIDDKPVGRILIGLFGETVPRTVENFKILASKGIEGKRYAGSPFHRVIKRFMIQGGDVVNFNGTGSVSIYGKTFPDENFEINHTTAGFLSMSNSGPNTNGCQFFITTTATPWLDGKHTVFGKVLYGNNIIHKIEYLHTDGNHRPLKSVVITDSGLEPLEDPYEISDEPYGLWAWVQASVVPLGWSFSILGFFHWVMKKLDSHL